MARLMRFAPTMLRNLFQPPVTTKYPAEPIDFPERSRGHIEIVIDKCIGCGGCSRNCPSGAIKVDKLKGTWDINRFDCVQCGYCASVCPVKCLTVVPGYQEPERKQEFAHYQKSPEVLAAEAKKRAEMAAKAAAAKKAMMAKKAAAAAAAKNAEGGVAPAASAPAAAKPAASASASKPAAAPTAATAAKPAAASARAAEAPTKPEETK
ncbi:MAG: 4Fe-4S dicluster domain-containing protein [Lachnospiraceae bacterium]|nr:4Fe-4S dicluster domain-containing protein [Lachnospiraceae bacterium]